jgi:two-component system, NarL family, response regulator LiaR
VTIRVVLADDHVLFRQGLRALLQDEPDLEIVGEADNGCQAVDVVLQTQPEVVLINLVIIQLEGVEVTRTIHHERPQTRILILSSTDEVDKTAMLGAVRAGAVGVIHKNVRFELLARAIRGAARGEVQFSPADARLLLQEVQEPLEQERLTDREVEVLRMISDGLANKEIALKLRISEKTVKKHVSMILDKFGLQSRTQAALHAWRVGLVRPDQLPAGRTAVISMGIARRRKVVPRRVSRA